MRRLSIAIALLACIALPAVAAGPDSNLAANDNGGGCYPQPLTGDLFSMLSLVNPEWAPVISTGLCNGGLNDGKSCTTDSDCADPMCTINCPVVPCVPIGTTPVLMHGTVNDVHGLIGGDFPGTHVTSDMVAELNLDAADSDRIATGNGGGLSLEWEAGAIPAFAWPGEGDRVVALGRWIFDCGHPDAIPGTCSTTTSQQCVANVDCTAPGCPSCVAGETCTGVTYRYSSEIHPPYAIASIHQGGGAVFSKRANARMYPVTRADVYISDFAGGAGDRCVLTHAASYLDLLSYGHQCFPLAQPVAAINSQNFVFDIPLPPRPVNGGGVRRKIIHYDRRADLPAGAKRARIVHVKRFLDAPQPYVEVTVKLMGRGAPNYLAETILYAWQRDRTPLTHVRVTLQSLVVNNPVRPATPISPRTCSSSSSTTSVPCSTDADCAATPLYPYCQGVGPVKGWYMDAEVNGNWQRFTNLDSVNAGDEIAENLVYDEYVPASSGLHIAAKGQSQECIDAMYGKPLAIDLLEQGLSKGANCILSAPRPIGTFDVTYPGPDFGAGSGGSTDYNIQSVGGNGGHCSTTTTTLCVGAADCPSGESCVITGGAFNLKYRIERIP